MIVRELIGVASMDVDSSVCQSTYDQVKTKDVKRRHFASNLIMRYITGSKFEQHHSNISRDILDFVIYLSTKTICDVINFSAKTLISMEQEKIFKTPFLFSLKSLSNKRKLFFTLTINLVFDFSTQVNANTLKIYALVSKTN